MSSEDFFNLLENQLEVGKPVVSYRLPEKSVIHMLAQNSEESFRIQDFSESGFIFSPFKNSENPLFIPEKGSTSNMLLDFEALDLNKNNSEEKSSEKQEKSKTAHIALVSLGIKTIKEGKLQKVVLSRKEIQRTSLSAIEIFQNLLSLYQDAFVYIWSHPETGIWIGASPEKLLKTERTKFSTMALAGTRKLQDFSENNWTQKEITEQQLVTDSIVSKLNALGYSEDNLKISKTYNSEAGSLLHLRTDISGFFKTDASEIDNILKALHPTPAICGLPTNEAYKFILAHENYAREFYTGYLGPLNMTTETKRSSRTRNQENQAYSSIRKDSSLFVNLRCLKYEHGEVEIYVGGGITVDSDPTSEWEETVNKTRTMKAAL